MPACLIVALALGSVGPATLFSAEPTTADPVAAANALSQAFRNAAEQATPVLLLFATKQTQMSHQEWSESWRKPFPRNSF